MILYSKQSFAVFDQEDYTKTLLQLSRPARHNMLQRIETRQQERQAWTRPEEKPTPATDTP